MSRKNYKAIAEETQQSIAVRYLLVELPLADGSNGTEDPEDAHYRIRSDVADFLWEDPALADSVTVSLVYPGDVVPGGVDE